MPIHAPFEFFGHISPNDVTNRSNFKKDCPLAKTRHLNHKARILVARFELGVGARIKGKNVTGKVRKGLYFTYLWRSPH